MDEFQTLIGHLRLCVPSTQTEFLELNELTRCCISLLAPLIREKFESEYRGYTPMLVSDIESKKSVQNLIAMQLSIMRVYLRCISFQNTNEDPSSIQRMRRNMLLSAFYAGCSEAVVRHCAAFRMASSRSRGVPSWQRRFVLSGRPWVEMETSERGCRVFMISYRLVEFVSEHDTAVYLDDEEGIVLLVDEEVLSNQVIPAFQAFMLQDMLIESMANATEMRQESRFYNFMLQNSKSLPKLLYVVENLYPPQDSRFYGMRENVLSFLAELQSPSRSYQSVVLVHESKFRAQVYKHKKPARWKRGDGGLRDTSPPIATQLPDIENLTAYLPRCLRQTVRLSRGEVPRAGVPGIKQSVTTGLPYSERKNLVFQFMEMQYPAKDATAYLKITEPDNRLAYSLRGSQKRGTGCTGVVTFSKNPGAITRCPFVGEDGVQDRKACAADMGLADSVVISHPLEVAHQKLAQVRERCRSIATPSIVVEYDNK